MGAAGGSASCWVVGTGAAVPPAPPNAPPYYQSSVCVDIDDPAAIAAACAEMLTAPPDERRALRAHCREVACTLLVPSSYLQCHGRTVFSRRW